MVKRGERHIKGERVRERYEVGVSGMLYQNRTHINLVKTIFGLINYEMHFQL